MDSVTEAIIFMQLPQLISINRSGLVTLTALVKVLIEAVVRPAAWQRLTEAGCWPARL